MNILLTGACGVTSRAVARSLAASQHFRTARLVGSDVCENLYGIYEGLCERIYRVPRNNEPGYRGVIEEICRAESIDVAIVIPELEVLHWAENPMPVPALLPPPGFCRAVIGKGKLYQLLQDTGLVPKFAIVSRDEILGGQLGGFANFPVWVRDFADGVTSGKGALKVESVEEAKAWVVLNRNIDHFMVAEFLPGRNLACFLLYYKGELLKAGIYERLEYFMGRTVMSGISGNISRGRLLTDEKVVEASRKAVSQVLEQTGETMHGLITVDLRESAAGDPLVTEINLRHVAGTSSFSAVPGADLVEAHLFAALGQPQHAGPSRVEFPANNLILRDIDGRPRWVREQQLPKIGQYIDRPESIPC